MKTNVSKWTTVLAVTVGGAMLATSAIAQSGAVGSAAGSADTSKSDAPKSNPDTRMSDAPKSKPDTTKNEMPTPEASKNGPSQDTAERAQVKAVQQALKDKGHDPGAVDGEMGPKTEAALRDYQQREGLTATGTADAETMAKLAAASPSAGSATETSKDSAPAEVKPTK
jgi:peptidoglycan hydrolase-like protein with peptidoglycan-binding domain